MGSLGEWIEKNRLSVGLGLIALILISSAVLAWKLQKGDSQGELVEAQNKIVELENRLEKLEQKSANKEEAVVSSQTAETAAQPATNQPVAQGKVAGVVSGLVNINTASVSELDSLPGIGPVYAQRIIDYRNANGPFASIDAIQSVKGIGAKTFAKFKDKITVN